jgi:hypothetical protein
LEESGEAGAVGEEAEAVLALGTAEVEVGAAAGDGAGAGGVSGPWEETVASGDGVGDAVAIEEGVGGVAGGAGGG